MHIINSILTLVLISSSGGGIDTLRTREVGKLGTGTDTTPGPGNPNLIFDGSDQTDFGKLNSVVAPACAVAVAISGSGAGDGVA